MKTTRGEVQRTHRQTGSHILSINCFTRKVGGVKAGYVFGQNHPGRSLCLAFAVSIQRCEQMWGIAQWWLCVQPQERRLNMQTSGCSWQPISLVWVEAGSADYWNVCVTMTTAAGGRCPHTSLLLAYTSTENDIILNSVILIYFCLSSPTHTTLS